MRWLILTTAVVLTSLGLGVGLSLGQQSDVIGSKHDIGSPGVSACEQCHIPHNAYGDYLWARNPDRADGLYLELKELCYSCHDGTVTDRGDFAFDQNLSQHPTNPGKRGEDCDMCHDAHGADYGNFLLFPAGANFASFSNTRIPRQKPCFLKRRSKFFSIGFVECTGNTMNNGI